MHVIMQSLTINGVEKVVFILIYLFNFNYSAKKECVGNDQCSCTFNTDNKKIDLTSLGNTDETARFPDVKSPDGNTYSYNPCFPFNEQTCDNVAVCSVNSATGTAADLGDAQSAKFAYDGTDVTVTYTSSGGTILKLTNVVLKCDPTQCTPKLAADGSQGLASYQLTLTTVCACRDGCTESGPTNCNSSTGGASSGIGGGVIILIVFFVTVVLYFVGGVLFMKFNRHATGVEVIPNVEFWKCLPGLIKAGFQFTIRPCIKRRGYQAQ